MLLEEEVVVDVVDSVVAATFVEELSVEGLVDSVVAAAPGGRHC